MQNSCQVRIVVVNFDGGDLTLACLKALVADQYSDLSTQIVLVDNGSLDNVVDTTRAKWPEIEVIEPLENLGFGGGCNLGIQLPGSFDYVALVNPDAAVEPGWLQPMVKKLESDSALGAASPKMLFAGEKAIINLNIPDAGTLGDEDTRELGVRLVDFRLNSDGKFIDGSPILGAGWYGYESPIGEEKIAVWSKKDASLLVSIEGLESPEAEIQVKRNEPASLFLESADQKIQIQVGSEPVWVKVDLSGADIDVVQNAGSQIHPGGHGGDRGFREIDNGQFDEAEEMFAWCGGAVLLRPDYLKDVGVFDEKMFLYYEDFDLSWRGQLKEWKYCYVPSAVVRHHHAQSTGEWSPLFRFYVDRNRLLVLVKNGPAKVTLIETARAHAVFFKILIKDFFVPLLKFRIPKQQEVKHQIRYLLSFWKQFPAALRHRLKAKNLKNRSFTYESGLGSR